MGVCARPLNATKTDYSSAGSFIATPPSPTSPVCGGGGSTTIITPPSFPPSIIPTCPCPTAGCTWRWDGEWAVGKQYTWESGTPCVTSIVSNKGKMWITKSTHVSSTANEPNTGADWAASWDEFFGSSSGMVWKGDWAAAEDYVKNDTVRLYSSATASGFGNAYVCVGDHRSAVGNSPPNAEFWAPATEVGAGGTIEKGLFDSVFDWLADAVSNGDWLSLLAAGVGVAAAGALITKMFTQDGKGDGNASSVFNGTPGFTGSSGWTAPTLPQVVTSIMRYAGKTGAEINVSLLPSVPCQFTIAGTAALSDLIDQLSLTYQFDVVPSGGVVKFVPKNLTSVRTLTTADLGHLSFDQLEVAGAAPYTAKRLQGIDLPRSVTFNYVSAGINYNTFSQVATLETYTEGQDVKIDVPFTLTDEDAKRVAESALVNAHIERQQMTFVTDIINIDLEPADIVTVPIDSGGTMDVRIVEIATQEDGLMQLTAVRADQNTSTYQPSGVSDAPPPAQVSAPSVIGYSGAVFIEVPPLLDSDINPRYFAAIHGYAEPGWPGAMLYASKDGGASYNFVAQSSSTVTMGMMQSIPVAPSKGYHVWDDTSTLTVKLRQGVLTSATSDLDVQNGANWCKIGEEIIGFRNVTLIAPQTYQLTRLLRGRVGTETHVSDHVADELFVLFDGNLTEVAIDRDDMGKLVKYKVVTFGSDLSKAEVFDVRPFGLNMRPWRIAHPKAVREMNGDWTISWIGRSRYQNSLRDYTEIRNDPDWAGWAVAILDPSNNIKRTATSAVPTFTYTAEMQAADFGSMQTTLNSSIVQMTSLVGGGYPYVVTA